MLSEISKVDDFCGLKAMFWTFFPIGIALFLFDQFPHPVIFILSWLILSNRMLAMYALLHDALHYLLFSNRRINDGVAQLFLAFPLGISLKQMRALHLAHHQHLHSDKDPEGVHKQYAEFQFPMTLSFFLKIALLDLTGLHWAYYRGKKMWMGFRTNTGWTNQVIQLVQPILMLAAWVVLWIRFPHAAGVLGLWCFAYVSGFQFLNRIRLSTEHFLLREGNAFGTRSVITGPISRWIFSPGNLGYHTEHHLYPKVPAYRLPLLHRQLIQSEVYRKGAEIHRSYRELWERFITRTSDAAFFSNPVK